MRAPAMRRQETREIHGAKCLLVLTRVTRDANFCGWRIKATIDGHIVTNDFTNILELDRAFDRAEERAIEAIEGKRLGKKSDLIYSEIMDLSVQETRDLFWYLFGMMQERITDDDIELLENKLKEIDELRKESLEHQRNMASVIKESEESDLTKDIPTEELLPAMPSLCEVKGAAEEEVDVSDCCHSEDVQTVQPPLRSSVQSSPDDPYYVCGYCGDKCEIVTIKRSELED